MSAAQKRQLRAALERLESFDEHAATAVKRVEAAIEALGTTDSDDSIFLSTAAAAKRQIKEHFHEICECAAAREAALIESVDRARECKISRLRDQHEFLTNYRNGVLQATNQVCTSLITQVSSTVHLLPHTLICCMQGDGEPIAPGQFEECVASMNRLLGTTQSEPGHGVHDFIVEAPTISVLLPNDLDALLACHGCVQSSEVPTACQDVTTSNSPPVEDIDECSRYSRERARERLQRGKMDENCVTH